MFAACELLWEKIVFTYMNELLRAMEWLLDHSDVILLMMSKKKTALEEFSEGIQTETKTKGFCTEFKMN